MKYLNILNSSKKTILSVAASLLLVSSVSASTDKVYAVVNGDNITGQTIAMMIKDPKFQFDKLGKAQQDEILNRIIEQKLLAQNAVTTDVVNTPLYKSTISNIKQDLALQFWIEAEGKKVDIKDKELKDFYNNNSSMFKVPEQLHARHILVKTQKEANDIIDTLNKTSDKKTKFIELAKTKSIGPSGKNGGDLGFFTADKMVPEFSKATSKLKKATITSTPVKTQFGFHIIYLEDKKESTNVKFEQAKNQIKQKLGQDILMKNIQKLANELKQKAKIQYK